MVPRPRNAGSKDLPPNLYRKTDKRNGHTYYTYRDPITGRMFGLGKDKDSAIREAIAANFAEVSRPTLGERVSAPTAIKSRLFTEWLEEYRAIYAERGLSVSSNKNVGMRIKRLDVEFGQKDIRSITTIDVAGYLTRMAKEGKAQMSRAMRSLLRDTFMEAMAAGWTDVNPVEVTKAARVVIKRERLTVALWKAIHEEAKQPWLKRVMELAVLTGQRRDDLASMLFKDEREGFLHVIQSKTGARLRISTTLRLECLGLELGAVIKQCRDRVLSQHLVHHSRTISRAKAGMPIVLDTLSKEFSAARDRAAVTLGVDLGKTPPTFHEMRSLAARLHAAEGRDPQLLLGHRSAKMTDLYRDNRGAEWIDVA
ncbi:phage integrase Arm DNA-binding domain-containing protein [Pseudomonas viridiflava]|uniref:phage integrase Arm DNA-binding domain-containing protein n=1 Tax=Pseudomonas viridiflava TaxID=33069 RepID=UPI000F0202BF|nr:phage integrase Arm DNA-binding domain-containing protein [Pseudomonas viridiflava]